MLRDRDIETPRDRDRETQRDRDREGGWGATDAAGEKIIKVACGSSDGFQTNSPLMMVITPPHNRKTSLRAAYFLYPSAYGWQTEPYLVAV